jgi:hypothetical protein
MEAAGSSGTLVKFYWTAWRYIPEDGTLHSTAVKASNPTTIIPICYTAFVNTTTEGP